MQLLFDRALSRRRLRRASRQGYEDVLFRHACADLDQRLAVIKRDFPLALDWESPAAYPAGSKIGRLIVAAPFAREGAALVADGERVPFAPACFDLCLSILGLQAVNDLPGALIQIRRILKPDGLFMACLLGGATLGELRQAFAEAETECEGGISPRVAPFPEIRDMGDLLQRAGFALPVTDLDRLTLRYRHPFDLLKDLRAMGMTNTLLSRRRTPLRRATLMRMAEFYAARFSDADGKIRATFDLVWLSGWAPHESQQKPLKPGSARMALSEALKGREGREAPE